MKEEKKENFSPKFCKTSENPAKRKKKRLSKLPWCKVFEAKICDFPIYAYCFFSCRKLFRVLPTSLSRHIDGEWRKFKAKLVVWRKSWVFPWKIKRKRERKETKKKRTEGKRVVGGERQVLCWLNEMEKCENSQILKRWRFSQQTEYSAII